MTSGVGLGVRVIYYMLGMNRSTQFWRTVAGIAAACVLLGVARGWAQAILNDLPAPLALRRGAVAVAVSLFWLPVCLTVGATWRLRQRRARYAILLAVLAGLTVTGEALWAVSLQNVAGLPGPPFSTQVVGRFDTSLVFFVSIVALVWLRERSHARAALARRAAVMDAAVAMEQLYVLALQLHPHFLFNTLNLASQLVYSDRAAARNTIAHLRTLLLESLEHASSRDIPLREELRFLSSYLAIQHSRFGDRLVVTVDAEPVALDAAVPHLLLQPLVENAVAHGIVARESGGRVDLRARREGSRLHLTIEDDGIGLPDHIHERLGLTITRQRLRQLFAGDFSLALERNTSRSGTRIEIDAPYRAFVPQASMTQPITTSQPAPAGAQPTAPWWTRLSLPVQLGVTWLALALVWIAADAPHMHGASAMGWARQTAFGIANAAIWSGLSLVPLALSRRFDVGERPRLRTIGTHLLAACATSLVHLTAWLSLLHHFGRTQYEIQLRNRFAWFVWDIAVYTALVAFATVASLGRRARETALSIQRADAELLRTRLAGLRLRLQPSMLVRSLDAVGAALEGAPEHAERVIARLGDFLRALLAARDHDFAPLDEELELLRAYLDVVGAVPVRIDARDSVAFRSARVPATIAPALLAVLREPARVAIGGGAGSLTLTVVAADEIDPDIQAVRERLEACYGDGATLEVIRHPSDMEIRITCPVRPAAGDIVRAPDAELAVA